MAGNIQGLSLDLKLDTIGIDEGLAGLRRKLSVVNSEMRANMSAFDRGEKSVNKYNTQLTGLNKKLDTQKVAVSAAKTEYEQMVAQHGEGSKQAEIAARAYNNEAASLNNLERHVGTVTAELAAFEDQQRLSESGWTRLSETLENVGGRMTKAGDAMKKVGKKMSTYVTAPLFGMGGLAFKAAVDFESAFAGVAKTFSGTTEQLNELESGIRNMAKEIPASTTEISAVAEAAGQLGIKAENIEDFTRTMIDMGEATNLSSDEAATSFAQFANVVGMSQDDFSKLGSSVVALGNSMATTEADIVNMAMRLSGTGAQVGLTEADIMALSASMASVGINAEAGGSAMSTVMKKITNAVADGGKGLDGFAKASGLSSKEFADKWKNDPITALDSFIKGLSASSGEGKNLNAILGDLGIKGLQETDTLLRMAGASDILSEAVGISSKAWKDDSALTEEAAQRYETMASQMAILKNTLIDVAIDIGGILAPAVMAITEKIKGLVEWFGGLSDTTKKNIVVFAGIAAVIGPLLFVFGTLASSIGAIFTAFGTVSAALAVVSTGVASTVPAVGALAAVFGAVTLPVLATVAAIAGVVIGVGFLVKHLSKDAIPEVERFGDSVSKTTKEALGGFFELSDGVSESLMAASWAKTFVTFLIGEEEIDPFWKEAFA